MEIFWRCLRFLCKTISKKAGNFVSYEKIHLIFIRCYFSGVGRCSTFGLEVTLSGRVRGLPKRNKGEGESGEGGSGACR